MRSIWRNPERQSAKEQGHSSRLQWHVCSGSKGTAVDRLRDCVESRRNTMEFDTYNMGCINQQKQNLQTHCIYTYTHTHKLSIDIIQEMSEFMFLALI
jgi:hypothetical protein